MRFVALLGFILYFTLFIICVCVLQMVPEKLQEVLILILGDNVDFEPNFRDDLEQVLEEAHRLAPQWDLMSVKCSGALILGKGCDMMMHVLYRLFNF